MMKKWSKLVPVGQHHTERQIQFVLYCIIFKNINTNQCISYKNTTLLSFLHHFKASDIKIGRSTLHIFLQPERHTLNALPVKLKRNSGKSTWNLLLRFVKYYRFLLADVPLGNPPPPQKITLSKIGTVRMPFCWFSTPNPPTRKMAVNSTCEVNVHSVKQKPSGL
jgi:hypothetical protein